MDVWSEGGVKNYVPAFFIIIVFTFFDMICCMKLKVQHPVSLSNDMIKRKTYFLYCNFFLFQLPKIKMSENILKDLLKVIRHKSIIIFVVFATLVGVLDGFIIYFMFW